MAQLFSRYESGLQLTAGTMTGSIDGTSGLNPLIDRINSISTDNALITGSIISGTSTKIYSNAISGAGVISGTVSKFYGTTLSGTNIQGNVISGINIVAGGSIFLNNYFLKHIGDQMQTNLATFCQETNGSVFYFAGGNAYNSGGVISVYGPTCAVTPNRVRINAPGDYVDVANNLKAVGSVDAVSLSGTNIYGTTISGTNIKGTFIGNVTGNVTGSVFGGASGATMNFYGDNFMADTIVSGVTVIGNTLSGTNLRITNIYGQTLISGPTIIGTNISGVSFRGALVGNVTGNVTGNLTGDVTGDVAGWLSGTTALAYVAATSGPGAISGTVSKFYGGGLFSGTSATIYAGSLNQASGMFIIETRTSDPANPATGRMWLRTDL